MAKQTAEDMFFCLIQRVICLLKQDQKLCVFRILCNLPKFDPVRFIHHCMLLKKLSTI